jgi:HPt (histidine-containing phosphotransfer) domain-containing protein
MKTNRKAETSQSEIPIFDREVLAHHTMHDADLQQQVLGMFFTQLASVRARVEQGPVPGGEGKILAHTLRGAASAIGAERIAALARFWEDNPIWSPQLHIDIARAADEFMAAASQT